METVQTAIALKVGTISPDEERAGGKKRRRKTLASGTEKTYLFKAMAGATKET